jgi:hypothetical protein
VSPPASRAGLRRSRSPWCRRKRGRESFLTILRKDSRPLFYSVDLGLDRVPAPDDLAVAVDQVSDSRDAHVLLPVHGLLLPRAVAIGDGVILVGEKRERQVELLCELRLALRIEHADAEDGGFHLAEVGKGRLEVAGFLRAAGRVVLGVEVEDHGLAGIVLETARRPVLIGKRERRGFLTFFNNRHVASVPCSLARMVYSIPRRAAPRCRPTCRPSSGAEFRRRPPGAEGARRSR